MLRRALVDVVIARSMYTFSYSGLLDMLHVLRILIAVLRSPWFADVDVEGSIVA